MADNPIDGEVRRGYWIFDDDPTKGTEGRPFVVVVKDRGNVSVFKITSRAREDNPAEFKKRYKIQDWDKAGLDTQSYIIVDVIREYNEDEFQRSWHCGQLTERDKDGLLLFWQDYIQNR
jgi:hypothetical protein